MPPDSSGRARRWPVGRLVPALALVVLGVLGVVAAGRVASLWQRGAGHTELTHALAVERVRSVARLVTSEATVRDVVVYENTRLGSTKRTLLVVTGRVLAGIDLDPAGTAREELRPTDGATTSPPAPRAADVRIDHEARRITIVLPPAEVLGVEVVDVRTYDERAGLLNPFRPADRDSIQREVRLRLERAGHEMGLLEQANRSAVELLRTLLARDGYTVDVSIRGQPVVQPGD